MAGVAYRCMNLLADRQPTSQYPQHCWCMYNYVSYRTYELKLHGGSPYESGVELDPAANLSGKELVDPL